MSTLSIPNTISNGINADGDNLGANFSAIATWANTEAFHADGSVAASGDFDMGTSYKITNLADPTADQHAATKAYVDARETAITAAYEADDTTHAALTEVHGITAFGASLVDDNNASAARDTLGLGDLATQSTISNDDWSGTDLAIANGGTGASSAVDAAENLQESWITETPLNDWSTQSGRQGPRYRRMGHMVYVQFNLQSSGAVNNNLFRLNTGYRPATEMAFPAASNDAQDAEKGVTVVVGTDGYVSCALMGSLASTPTIQAGFWFPLD